MSRLALPGLPGTVGRRRSPGRLGLVLAAAAAAGAAAVVCAARAAALCLGRQPRWPDLVPATKTRVRAKGLAPARRSRGQGLGFGTPPVSDEPLVGYDAGPRELAVLKYPHPALRRPNALVEEFDERLRNLANNLMDAMYKEADPPGLGLAAPQVGVNVRVMVFNALRDYGRENRHGEKVFVNPRIVDKSDKTCTMFEACLSFPEMEGPVVRPSWVEVEANDLDGKLQKVRFEGDEARVFQHEYDHLDGVLYVDRLEEEERAKVQPVLNRLTAQYKARGGKQPAL